MTETLPQIEAAKTPLNDQLVQADEQITMWSTPTVEQLAEGALMQRGITQLADHEYCDANGSTLDTEVVESLQKKLDPETYIFSPDVADEAENILGTKNPRDLSDASKQMLRAFGHANMTSDSSLDEVFGAFKNFVQSRKNLSETLSDIADEEHRNKKSVKVTTTENKAAHATSDSEHSNSDADGIIDLDPVSVHDEVIGRMDGSPIPSATESPIVGNNLRGSAERHAKKPIVDNELRGNRERKENSPIVGNNLRGAKERHAKNDDQWSDARLYDAEGTEIISEDEKAKMRQEDRGFADATFLRQASEWTNPTLHGDEWSETTYYRPENLKERFLNRVRWAYNKLGDLKERTLDYFSDEEKGKRRKIVGGVAGVLAVGAVIGRAYLESRGHSTISGTGHGHVQEHVGTHHGSHGSAHKAFQEVNLKPGSGDSIWHEEELHHPNATQHQIYERVERDLKANHLTWAKARHIAGKVKITR